jgi:hypothetical protein
MSTSEDDPASDLPWPAPAVPRSEVSDSIRKHCTHELCARRGPSGGKRFVISMALSLVVLVSLTLLGTRTRPEGALRAAVFGAMGWAIVQAVVLFVGLTLPPGRRGSRAARVLLAIGVPLLFLGYLGFASSSHLSGAEFLRDHAGRALGCGLHALVFGAAVATGMLFLWRGTDPLTPGLSGSLAGLAGGLGGAAAINVACPTSEAWHMWIAHGGIVVVLMALGWALGRRLLPP